MKKRKKIYPNKTGIILSLLTLLSICWQMRSQNLNDLRFESIDEEDGLSNHWITDIAQDSSGFLWIGTYNGLNRYDGHTFKIFKHKEGDSGSLLRDYGQEIVVDRQGRLWLSYPEGGFSLYNPDCQCFTHYQGEFTQIKYDPDKLFGIKYIDRNGKLWFSGNGMGLNIFDPKSKTNTHFDLPDLKGGYSETDRMEYNTVHGIYEAPDGLFWLATFNGLYSFNLSNRSFSYKPYNENPILHPEGDQFNKIFPDGRQGFWLSSWNGGMSYFNLSTEKFNTYISEYKKYGYNNLVYDFTPKNDEEFWIVAGDKGLGTFNKYTHQYQFIDNMQSRDGKPISFLNKILITRNQEIFLVEENLLLKYNPSSGIFNFKFLPIKESQHRNLFQIRNIFESPETNEIYFATDLGNGLNILNTKTNQLTALPVEVNLKIDPKMRLFNLTKDVNGKLWLLTRDFIYEFDPRRKKLYKIETPFQSDKKNQFYSFKNFVQAPDGNILVLTNGGNLYPFSINEKKILPGIYDNSIQKINNATFDSRGNLWIVGNKSIACRKAGSLSFQTVEIKQVPALDYRNVRGPVADSKGSIWIAINNSGILKIQMQEDGKTEQHFISAKEGLPTNRINLLNTDHQDNVWMATILGVVYMNTEKNTFKLFNQSVGMDKFTMGMRFLKSPHNGFYITAPGKYCKVDFEKLNQIAIQPKVYIDQFKIFNREKAIPLNDSSTIVLKPGEDYFSFDFGCIDFSNQVQNKFSYMLEGWDKDWIYSGARRYVSYTNLDEGKYTFKVKVSNLEGVWGNAISIPIIIETHFYKKTWFTLLAIFMVAALIYLLYLYRIRQIAKTEQMKTEFNKQLAETRMAALRAQMNPHFIFNCLNSINRYIIKSDIKTSSLYLTRFAKLIRLILDNSEHKYVVLSNEIEALKLYIDMESLRFDHKFTFEVEIAADVDAEHIEIPPLIIQPYVENAIWHGLMQKDSGGHLSVKVRTEGNILIIEVIDNGIGRIKAQEFKSKNTSTRKSIGMKLTEERLNINAAEISEMYAPKIIDLYDENQNACGTKVIIQIPL